MAIQSNMNDEANVLEMWVDRIEVTTMSADTTYDPNWVHTDSNGHVHRWTDGKLPTLEFKSQDWGPDEDGDDGTDYWYECRICRQHVTPGYREVPGTGGGARRFIPGAVHYAHNGREISEAEYAARLTTK